MSPQKHWPFYSYNQLILKTKGFTHLSLPVFWQMLISDEKRLTNQIEGLANVHVEKKQLYLNIMIFNDLAVEWLLSKC